MNVEQNKNPLGADEFGYQKAVVTWFGNVIKTSKKSRTVIDLGLCSYGGGIAFIAVYNPNAPMTQEFLRTMVIHDVYFDVARKSCEDGKWCLNLKCRLNSAQVDYFRKYGVRNRLQLEKVHELLENVKSDLKLENKQPGFAVRYKKSPVYLFTSSQSELERRRRNNSIPHFFRQQKRRCNV